MNKNNGEIIEKAMSERSSHLEKNAGTVSLIDGNEEELASYTVSPIIASGDPIGAVVIFSKDKTIGEIEQKSAETAASFLARQMES